MDPMRSTVVSFRDGVGQIYYVRSFYLSPNDSFRFFYHNSQSFVPSQFTFTCVIRPSPTTFENARPLPRPTVAMRQGTHALIPICCPDATAPIVTPEDLTISIFALIASLVQRADMDTDIAMKAQHSNATVATRARREATRTLILTHEATAKEVRNKPDQASTRVTSSTPLLT